MALIGLAGLLFGATVASLRWANRLTLQYGCDGRLGAIALALHQYHQDFGCFPPAFLADSRGRPMHSWRILVLASADYPARSIYESYRFDEPWNSPTNSRLAVGMAEFYQCPCDQDRPGSIFTNYVAIVGPGTIFQGDQPVALSDIHDGASDTLMVVEIADSNISWMEPRDLDVRRMSFLPNDPSHPSISSRDPGGPGAVLADGARIRLDKHFTSRLIKAMSTINGGEQIQE